MAAIIEVRDATKRFGAHAAVDRVSLSVAEGEFFALLGPSGCGKTTLLRLIAGFETADGGSIAIDGTDMTGVEPQDRPVGMVFQSYALFPHMTVAGNVGYGLRVTGVAKSEIERRVAETLALVKLDGYAERMPAQLSGGQRQRVALARALVKRPRVLLLDEPLSALDAKLREQMRHELVRLKQSVGITFVIVTHDQSEALSMADRVAVMELGRVRQIAAPDELYEHPNCRFVAEFIGRINLFDGRAAGVVEEAGGRRLIVEGAALGRVGVPMNGASAAASALAVGVRPEKVRLDAAEPDDQRIRLQGRVVEIAYFGETSQIMLALDGGATVSAALTNATRSVRPGVAVGDVLWASWDPADTLVLET
ncbi:MAG: ABC transporter ATP-binding protein [Alphaproteobacteria bacterium]|nr:ABC transporter ATP-binding protein [Alphaproteobacteria bacterium]